MIIRTVAAAAAVLVASLAAQAAPVTLITGATQGLYNAGIGTLLNGTSAAFPTTGDPTLDFTVAPDLSAAATPLGAWLSTPATPGGAWSGPQAIPATWTVGTETAIIYEFDAGPTGLASLNAQFGVDNGIFVWLNGVFMGGHLRPGGVTLGEFQFSVGALAAGTHYLQVLREDHGGATGYAVSIMGQTRDLPEPATLALVGAALLGLGLRRRARG